MRNLNVYLNHIIRNMQYKCEFLEKEPKIVYNTLMNKVVKFENAI